MTTFHAVVWMDHQEAHVLMFDREHVEAHRIKSRSHHKHQGKPHDIKLAEGCIYLLPANVPHAPMRGPDTVGLIIERIRKGDLLDTHRWYCEKCNNVLFEKTVKIEVLERDMPPVFEAYYGDPENQHCKKCGNINPGRPAKK